jgi:hypothetical protein
MLIIRKQQIETLEVHAREKFIRVMRRHLGNAFPDQCASLGEEGLRARIESGMAKAEAFGLLAEQDVAGLIHFTFEAGADFDQRPELEWAVAVLRDAEPAPSERVDRLFAEWASRRPPGGGR